MVSETASDQSSNGRSTPGTPARPATGSPGSTNDVPPVQIASDGDIVLSITHTPDQAPHLYRVSSSVLKLHSRYFASLLQAGRFSEADDVESKHKLLREQYGTVAKAPLEELPVLHIEDVGRIAVKSVRALLADLLSILHGDELQALPPVTNLANLTVVADRFDALDVVRNYLRRKKTVRTLDTKTVPKTEAALVEEKVRQRLLVGLLLDYPQWVEKYSLRMICKGWAGTEVATTSALWWDLPTRLEEELAYRRDCILETIQSLQAYFLSLYTSRERQCKLGYDSSAQCDSFQLGEMVRFFSRIGTLQLQGTIIDASDPPDSYAGDLVVLLDTLRQVPEYQIDKFHTHCGIRTRLVPLLDLLQQCVRYAAVCADCWHADRRKHAWVGEKKLLMWKRQDYWQSGHGHESKHNAVRDLFTATERQWS